MNTVEMRTTRAWRDRVSEDRRKAEGKTPPFLPAAAPTGVRFATTAAMHEALAGGTPKVYAKRLALTKATRRAWKRRPR